VVVLAFRDAAVDMARESDKQQKMAVVERFRRGIATTALEAVTEAWELVAWVLKKLLGMYVFMYVRRWCVYAVYGV
jgi:hypothetical protein